ncbi:N-formylglutamate amidohydrolase [Rhodobacteraceae bacterium NNCM2]|nr:N-formylglutamate amidohydrolase [Coraliihabitans acroporae]
MTFHPVEERQGRPDGIAGLVLVCDHASNAVPPEIGTLGLSDIDMTRHIAFDVGARAVTLGLADRLGAPAIMSTWSRLVIDPNRSDDDPTLVMRLYDGSIIPGNRSIDEAEIQRRIDSYHAPYHRAIDAALDRVEATGVQPMLVSIHSFTPQLKGKAPRPWHIGVLWDQDDRLVKPLLEELGRDTDLCIGDNEPYHGALKGDCMWQHGTRRGIAHVLIEIRNDLIETPEGQARWVDLLAPILTRAIAEARTAPISCGEEETANV